MLFSLKVRKLFPTSAGLVTFSYLDPHLPVLIENEGRLKEEGRNGVARKQNGRQDETWGEEGLVGPQKRVQSATLNGHPYAA